MRHWSSGAAVVVAVLSLSGCAPVSGKVPANLAGTRWLAEDIDGRGVMDDLQSTLEFAAPDSASGNLGCNRFTASFTQSGPGLRFGPVAATRRMCPEAVMDQEGRFSAVLGRTRGALVKAPFLYLLDERGSVLARLVRHEPAAAGSAAGE